MHGSFVDTVMYGRTRSRRCFVDKLTLSKKSTWKIYGVMVDDLFRSKRSIYDRLHITVIGCGLHRKCVMS